MPGDFDATTQHFGKPLYASQQIKKQAEAINELSWRRAKEKTGKYKFKRNEKGEYVDKDGNVIDVSKYFNPNVYNELSQGYRPLSFNELRAVYGYKPYAGAANHFINAEGDLKVADQLEAELKAKAAAEDLPLSKIPSTYKTNETEEEAADRFNKAMLGKGLEANEEYAPFQRYTGERVQGFSPEQEQLVNEANMLPAQIANSRGRSVLEKSAQPGSQTQEILDSSRQFMTPYQDLFKSWEQQASDQFKERMKNEFNPRFIASGTWGSGPHRNFLQKALVENQKNLNHSKIEHLLKAQERAQDKGSSAYQARQQDIANLLSEEGNTFKKNLASIGVREGLQKQKQELGQKNKDIAYLEAIREKEHPIRMAQIMSDLVSGVAHHVPSEVTTMNMGTNPAASQPSTNTVNAALGLQAAGMLGKYGAQGGGFKEGGSVYKKYAPGGGITSFMSAPQQSYLGPQNSGMSSLDLVKSKVNERTNRGHSQGIMDLFANAPLEMNRPRPTDADIGLNTPEINKIRQHATNLENTPHTPFWDSLAAFGAGMLGSGGKNTNEMLMGGGPKSLEAFNKSYSDKEARGDKIANLNSAIQDTRQVQMDREMNYRKSRDDLNMDRIKANAAERRSARDYALDERKFGLEEKKYKQHGELELAKIGKTKVNKLDQTDKDIQKDVQLMLKNAPEMQAKLDRLTTLSKKIKSGGLLGNADPYYASFPGGQGNKTDLEEFDKLAADLVLDSTKAFGAKAGVQMANLVAKSKPVRANTPEGNRRNLENIRHGLDRHRERSEFISEATVDYDISPKKASQLYSEYEKRSRKDRNASPWEAIDPNKLFENHHYSYLERLSSENPKIVQKMYEDGLLDDQDINSIAEFDEQRKLKKAA